MDGRYNLNDLAMMTGFTTRTLRNYMNQGLLRGEKENGVWRFTSEDVEAFFSEPYVKEGLRIKRSSIVFDFLADRKKVAGRACVILDQPCSRQEASAISSFFCDRMNEARDAVFAFDWDGGISRLILSGAEDEISSMMKAYTESGLAK